MLPQAPHTPAPGLPAFWWALHLRTPIHTSTHTCTYTPPTHTHTHTCLAWDRAQPGEVNSSPCRSLSWGSWPCPPARKTCNRDFPSGLCMLQPANGFTESVMGAPSHSCPVTQPPRPGANLQLLGWGRGEPQPKEFTPPSGHLPGTSLEAGSWTGVRMNVPRPQAP